MSESRGKTVQNFQHIQFFVFNLVPSYVIVVHGVPGPGAVHRRDQRRDAYLTL